MNRAKWKAMWRTPEHWKRPHLAAATICLLIGSPVLFRGAIAFGLDGPEYGWPITAAGLVLVLAGIWLWRLGMARWRSEMKAESEAAWKAQR